MNTNSLYKRFSNESTFIADNFEKLIRFNNWNNYFGFQTIEIDRRIWLLEPVLNKINSQFEIESCGILKIEPFTSYNWHTDTNRGLTINMLMKETPSHSLFGFEKDQYNTNFVELKYEPKSFYLFNTQHMHSVINFQEPRCVFSAKFKKDKKDLTYQEVYDWCLQERLFNE